MPGRQMAKGVMIPVTLLQPMGAPMLQVLAGLTSEF